MYKIFTETRKRRFLMRISIIYMLLLIGGFQLVLASNTRGQGLEEIMVTIDRAEKNLELLLKDIELQTDLTFAYMPSDVMRYKNIVLQPGKQSVKNALDHAFQKTELNYRYVENSIILFPEPVKKSSPNEDHAVLRSASNHRMNRKEDVVVPALIYSSRSEEHTSELQSRGHLVCRLLL